MALARLIIAAVRNVRHADIVLAPGLNVLLGPNGSGKSSVLEAVHLLSQGRSFRSGNARSLISYGEKELAVSVSLDTCSSRAANARKMGISISGGERRRRIDDQTIERQAELARLLPVVMVQPSSQILLDSSPDLRRQYMDWGAFHAYGKDFMLSWRRFGKCLEQRNALLRSKANIASLAVWEKELGCYGEDLARHRGAYLVQLKPYLAESVFRLAGNLGVLDFIYDQGWPAGASLLGAMATVREKDRRLGYSSLGPQRGDFRMTVDGVSVRQLSRGQQKLVVAALKMAQARLAQVQGASGGDVCLLVDDLAAELDMTNRRIFLEYLQDAQLQALVTGTGADQFEGAGIGEGAAMFHVEHGCVTPA